MKSWVFIGMFVSVGAMAAACSTKTVPLQGIGGSGGDFVSSGNQTGGTQTSTGTNTTSTGTGTTSTGTNTTSTGTNTTSTGSNTTSTGSDTTTGANMTGATPHRPAAAAPATCRTPRTDCGWELPRRRELRAMSLTPGLRNAAGRSRSVQLRRHLQDCACAAARPATPRAGRGRHLPSWLAEPAFERLRHLPQRPDGMNDPCVAKFQADCQANADCTDHPGNCHRSLPAVIDRQRGLRARLDDEGDASASLSCFVEHCNRP